MSPKRMARVAGAFYLITVVAGIIEQAVIAERLIGIKAFSRLFYIAPALVLGGTQFLNTFSAEQLQSIALLFYKVNEVGAAIALAG